ncbi:MAG: RNA-binding S4 domain-containing protein [Prevotella sp.]|nr:RNA-binding S4 domain-containing protein [Bacteroidales bacterium]MDD6897326.1 RNA-binding S4 domain-containing protein [Bacteroidales bacterium]MDY6026921.1 RNA-binding S4 domain-containing protein [Prevotella sp.]
MGNETARIDKWLWAARIFKTRSIAANACKNGRVTVNGTTVKPSRSIKCGEVVSVKKPPVTYSFKVLQCIEQRVGAKLVPQIYENVTDAKQYELLEMSRISGFVDRMRGTGRPTKKERRSLDAFIDPSLIGFTSDDDEDEFDFDDEDF